MKEKRIKINKKTIVDKYMMVLVLIVMVVAMTILKPEFLTSTNLLNIIRSNTPIMIMALGMTLIIITGGIDVSSGSVLALCGVIAASLAHPTADGSGAQYPLIVPILAALLIGAACGILNGLPIALGNVPPFIATLGMMTAARGAALLYTGSKPVQNLTENFEYIGRGYFLGIPVPIWILVFLIIVAYVILHCTKFGTYVYAVGSNEKAAEVSGVDAKKVKLLVYTIAGTLTGAAAIVLTARTVSGQPAAGEGYEMDAITSAIIGGTSFNGGIGTILGTVLGAVIMGVLNNGMTMLQVDTNLQKIVKGLVIVAAVLFDMRKNRRK